jgi:UDP-N-acetylmuramoylalanine--D-glutamate ligase
MLGLGRQGVALARYLAEAGARVTVTDQHPAERLEAPLAALSDLPIEYALGGHPESVLEGADLLCLSGGAPVSLPLAQVAIARGVPLSNDSQIFLENVAKGVRVIGITGSSGKTTTTTLVGRMSAAADAERGTRTFVGGNIGRPLIADLAWLESGDTVVMELSSFQLEIMTRSPHVAAVLNVTPNHLDRHGTLEAYTAAKARLLTNQRPGDIAVLGRDDPGARALAPLARGKVTYFSAQAPVAEGAFLDGEALVVRSGGHTETAATLSDIALRGRHNLLNALAACAISQAAGLPPEAMRAGLAGFAGVEHRLELVRERGGVRWYNDSIATAPERVIAALHSFDEPMVLLLGGRDKHLPWDELARLVSSGERVKAAVLFGEAGPLIEAALTAAGVPAERRPRRASLAEALPTAAALAEPGDVVVLAPGCTAFDEFHDFAERGERFREWVRQL